MVDVFLSYSRHDEAAVRRLAQKIEAEGYDVWWDAELPPHKSYGEVIEEKVASAKAAVVVWSPTAAKSEWVRAEADMARNQRKLIQTALGDIMPPLPFNQIQFADIGEWQGEDDHTGWRKVKASLFELCGQPGESATASIAMATASPTPTPSPAPEPARDSASAGSEPSKWPLFAGIGIAALAIVGAGALLLGAMGNGGSGADAAIGGSETPALAAADTPKPAATAAPDEAPSPQAPTPEPALPPVQSAAPRGGGADNGAARARRVGCYFSNTAFTYDGACHFAAGAGGDFMTRSLDGPYFMDVRQIGLDVTSEGRGVLEIYYNGGEIQRTEVQRSSTDRSCWEGPKLAFCAR